MKKLISILMLFAILLSVCACGTEEAAQQTTQATDATQQTTEPAVEATTPVPGISQDKTPEELYGHINQLEAVNGVYKIWSEVGVQNMADHPEGVFEILCNVDMQGAALRPIGSKEKPFTGEIKGANFVISNFAINESNEGYMGFVGYNEGFIHDLKLEGFTITADENTQYLGSIAGFSKARISRNAFTGTVTAEKAADNAFCGAGIGWNEAEFSNTILNVDLLVDVEKTATVGGILGNHVGGKVEYIDMNGAITVKGENKTVGLLAGTMAADAKIGFSAFVGADNSLNGELFTQLASNMTETSFEECAYRDNTPVVIPENEMKLRQRVVDAMLELTTLEWKVRTNLPHNEGIFNAGYTYYGMPYRHMGASPSRLKYLIDEEGYLNEIAYSLPSNELQNYMGNDCSTGLIHALWTVSNSVDFGHCSRQYPWDETGGCLYVGDWEPDPSLSVADSGLHIKYNGEQKMCEAYAQLKPGDFYVYNIPDVGGHTRMAAECAVVVRYQDGTIDPNRSYVVSHEQGWTTHDTERMTYTTCRANHKYTFANLLYDCAVPITCEELVTGEMEPATCELLNGDVQGKMGMVTGTVKTNYYLDYVDLVITDDQGNEILNHRMFPGVGRTGDVSDAMRRFYIDEFDLGRFVPVLAGVRFENGVTYSYKITATNSPGDTFDVKEGSFVQGSAE